MAPSFPSERKRVRNTEDRSPDLRFLPPPSRKRHPMARFQWRSSVFALTAFSELPWPFRLNSDVAAPWGSRRLDLFASDCTHSENAWTRKRRLKILLCCRRGTGQSRSQLRGSGGLSPPSRASWRLRLGVEPALSDRRRRCHENNFHDVNIYSLPARRSQRGFLRPAVAPRRWLDPGLWMLDVGTQKLVTPGRFELPTRSLGNCCSIHLSYGATPGCRSQQFQETAGLSGSALAGRGHLSFGAKHSSSSSIGSRNRAGSPRQNQPTCKSMPVAMPRAFHHWLWPQRLRVASSHQRPQSS